MSRQRVALPLLHKSGRVGSTADLPYQAASRCQANEGVASAAIGRTDLEQGVCHTAVLRCLPPKLESRVSSSRIRMPSALSSQMAILPVAINVEELFQAVADEPVLKDVCILLPHFSDDDPDVQGLASVVETEGAPFRNWRAPARDR
jgi:hypothetical protein